MSNVLSDISEYVVEKVSFQSLNSNTYVGMDNMIPNRGGITASEYVPSEGQFTAYCKGDILLGNIRPYFKKIWLAEYNGGCSPDVLCIRAKDGVSPLFLYAVLAQDAFFDYDVKGAKGSKMPRGDKNHIMSYPVPKIENAEGVGFLVNSIYRKIQNNKAICSDLEAMAKLLYDYWFVQFDFPDENDNPYKSSGGKMVWNEGLKREIPEGWECATVANISKRVKVGFVGTVDKYYCNPDIGFPIVRPAEMSSDGIDYSSLRHITNEFYQKNKKSQVHRNDILISRCGKDGIPNIYDSDEPAQVLNAVIIEPDNTTASSFFINEMLKSEYSQVQISHGTSGSVQGVINTEMIAKIKLPYKKEVVQIFSEKIKNYYMLMSNANNENQQLASLREFLLPMLMNGQVKVGNV